MERRLANGYWAEHVTLLLMPLRPRHYCLLELRSSNTWRGEQERHNNFMLQMPKHILHMASKARSRVISEVQAGQLV